MLSSARDTIDCSDEASYHHLVDVLSTMSEADRSTLQKLLIGTISFERRSPSRAVMDTGRGTQLSYRASRMAGCLIHCVISSPVPDTVGSPVPVTRAFDTDSPNGRAWNIGCCPKLDIVIVCCCVVCIRDLSDCLWGKVLNSRHRPWSLAERHRSSAFLTSETLLAR